MDANVVCKAIEFDGMSVNYAAQKIGMGQSSLQRFCEGQRGILLSSFVEACKMLDLQLVRIVDFEEAVGELWQHCRDEVCTQEYEPRKADSWAEYENENWPLTRDRDWAEQKGDFIQEYANEYEYDLGDEAEAASCEEAAYEAWQEDMYSVWHHDVYDNWSADYDDENLTGWENEAYSKFKRRERKRMDACEWIIVREKRSANRQRSPKLNYRQSNQPSPGNSNEPTQPASIKR